MLEILRCFGEKELLFAANLSFLHGIEIIMQPPPLFFLSSYECIEKKDKEMKRKSINNFTTTLSKLTKQSHYIHYQDLSKEEINKGN